MFGFPRFAFSFHEIQNKYATFQMNMLFSNRFLVYHALAAPVERHIATPKEG